MNHEVTRQILWNVPLALRIFLYGMLAEAAGFFGFPHYLIGMMEVR